MPRQKNKRFLAISTFTNTIQYDPSIRNINYVDWQNRFGNSNPITLELGCGRGEYTVELSRILPNHNFIGIDVKGDRIYIGAKQALDDNLTNVNFVRTPVQTINQIFQKNSIDQIWITFCDPQPNNPKKRLISPRFLKLYLSILKPNGTINLKTDSDLLFIYFLKILELTASKPDFSKIIKQTYSQSTTILDDHVPLDLTSEDMEFVTSINTKVIATNNLYESDYKEQHYGIKTGFEKKFTSLGQTIKFISISLVDNNS